jgi:hypothetical protein
LLSSRERMGRVWKKLGQCTCHYDRDINGYLFLLSVARTELPIKVARLVFRGVYFAASTS